MLLPDILRNQFSPVEIAEHVFLHLLAQKTRAVSVGGTCLYRDNLGRTCSVGCLVPVEVDTTPFESAPFTGMVATLYGPEGAGALDMDAGYGVTYQKLLSALQFIHDQMRGEEFSKSYFLSKIDELKHLDGGVNVVLVEAVGRLP